MDRKEPPVHPVILSMHELLAECDVRRQRRSGPGGQHRNKVASGVFLKHMPTGTEVSATERRSQHANFRVAIERLRIRLATEIRSSIKSPSTPSVLWKSRCVGGKVKVNPRHEDFPRLLAEALDVLQCVQWSSQVAADWLGCTGTQLMNLIELAPEAIAYLKRHRKEQGTRDHGDPEVPRKEKPAKE